MQDFIRTHAWFALNAALVAGLIVLGTLLQVRHESGEGAPAQAVAETPASSVTLGSPTTMTVESDAPAPAPAPAQPVRQTRQPVRQSDDDDD